jgi:hypothetical protein
MKKLYTPVQWIYLAHAAETAQEIHITATVLADYDSHNHTALTIDLVNQILTAKLLKLM